MRYNIKYLFHIIFFILKEAIFLPRNPRMYLNTEYFHVIVQGINKSFIFNLPIDMKFYIKNMNELKEKYNVEIIAYCVMNNHTHFLIKSKTIKNLSNYMHSLNTRYGCYYNKKYKRVGYVFRDRYKAEGIYSERQLYSCIKYIYNNPVKAGLCKKPEEYLYSNYRPVIKFKTDELYTFLDIEEDSKEICNKVLEELLLEKNISFEEIKKEEKELHRLFVTLKRDYKISLREIATNYNINREKVRKIFNKY